MKAVDTSLRALTGYRLQRATGAAMLRYKTVFARHGLRRTTFSCLSLVVDTPGLRQGQLGEVLAIERPNLVTIVEDLVSKGLITKETSPTDKRAYALFPTPQGTAVFTQAMADVQALDAEMVAGLTTKDAAVLHQALTIIERNAAKD